MGWSVARGRVSYEAEMAWGTVAGNQVDWNLRQTKVYWSKKAGEMLVVKDRRRVFGEEASFMAILRQEDAVQRLPPSPPLPPLLPPCCCFLAVSVVFTTPMYVCCIWIYCQQLPYRWIIRTAIEHLSVVFTAAYVFMLHFNIANN